MSFDLKEFKQSIDAKGINLIGVNVRQNDLEIGDFCWRTNDRLDMKSCSKGVTSLAVGIAVDEGLFSLNDSIIDCLGSLLPKHVSPNWETVKIRDLLIMASGHDHNIIRPTNFEAAGNNWIDYIFRAAPVIKPGTKFVYNNAAPFLCGCAIEARCGENVRDYLIPRLFDPLDIFFPQWFTCPAGHTRCMGGLFLNRFELAKIGQLCLNKGEWKGKRIVSSEWIQEASRAQIMQQTCIDDVTKMPEGDFAAGYGYFLWRNKNEGYRFNGRYGQFSVILPERCAVVTTTGIELSNEQGILDSIWDTILPQL